MNLKEPLLVLVPIFFIASLFLPDSGEVKVREIVIEREVRTEVLEIDDIYTVCHNDFKAWAVKTKYKNGKKSWFIAPMPAMSSSKHKDSQIMYGKRCDGNEKEHPGEINDDDTDVGDK